MANFLQTKFVALCFSLSLHIILYGVTSYMILIFLWISFHDSISFDLIYPSSHPLAFLYSSFSLSLFLFSSSRFFFPAVFHSLEGSPLLVSWNACEITRRHTNCDQWKVSACPLRSKDHLHSIRTKQTSQGFYITCHNGRTILDISVMTITEEKLQKLISGSEILALKKIRTGTHIIFKTCCFFFWVLKILHQLSLVNFFPYVLSPLGCFPSTIPGVNGFCEDFKPGRRLKVGLETHESMNENGEDVMEDWRWTWYQSHEDCYAEVNFIGIQMAFFMWEESETTLACCCLRTILQSAWPLTILSAKYG